MEQNFTDENFEDFLRDNADGLRMRPSEKVWENISGKLNRRRRRFGFFFGLSVLTTAAIGYFSTGHLPENRNTATLTNQPANTPSGTDELITKTEQNNNQTSAKVIPFRSPNNKAVPEVNSNTLASIVNTRPSDVAGSMVTGIPVNGSQAGKETDAAPFTSTTVDSYTEFDQAEKPKNSNLLHSAWHADPQTIESVINSYHNNRKKKPQLMVYFTPTVSYRKLSENKSYLRPAAATTPSYLGYYNVNSAVTHKPDFGFEVGASLNIPLLRNLNLRTGIQMNVSRYDIKAYNSSFELGTIMLNTRNGRDSLNPVTSLNNFNGYQSDWLQNYYLQLSMPVGLEYTFGKKGNNKNVHFGIASTIQPTYVLSDQNYVITTDYKNYAAVPDLNRKWNVNTNLETFVSYSTGQLKWQVGPQVRYQLMSSFISEYPVKENLFDFGLKVGIMLNR
jgi:hypothetical protein